MSNLLDWLIEHEPSFRKNRLPSLYSDLTVQKTSNPEGYAANVTAWQAALTRAALAGRLPSDNHILLQTSDELLNELASPQYGRPSGLGSVIDECIRNGKMIELKDFQTSEKSIYSRSWIPSPWSILQWSLRQAGILGTGSYDDSGRLRRGNLVLVQALEQISKDILTQQEKRGQSLTDRVMSRETFTHELNQICHGTVSEQDVDVILRYLSRDKFALSYDSKTIKFSTSLTSRTTPPEPITQEDTTIASLKSLITTLTTQAASLETNIQTLQTKAQTSIKQGNKPTALAALRSKKLAERTLTQRSDTLHKLEEVYVKIEEAVDQVAIIEAMEASAGVLKGLNQKVGGVERVDEVMDGLREEMEKVDEVGGVLREPLDGGKTAVDEDEVDEELEALEREERERVEARQAEETGRRLAELERVGAGKEQTVDAGSQKKEAKGEDVDVETEINRSVEQLKRMSIDVPNDGAGQEQAQRTGKDKQQQQESGQDRVMQEA